MARKYTKVEHLISIIEERTKAGETYREIGASLGLTREEVCGAIHTQTKFFKCTGTMPKNESWQPDTSRAPRDVRVRNPLAKKPKSTMKS